MSKATKKDLEAWAAYEKRRNAKKQEAIEQTRKNQEYMRLMAGVKA